MEGLKVNRRLRFGSDDDVLLLKEFISHNPLEDPVRWETIQQNISNSTGKDFKIRTLKDHVQLLLETFRKKDRSNRNRSGIEEVYTEQDHLLQQVTDMCSSYSADRTHKKQKITKEQQIAAVGKINRDAACAVLYVEENEKPTWEHDYLCEYKIFN
nr:unnamed protein product [Callosobruchus chinensis]